MTYGLRKFSGFAVKALRVPVAFAVLLALSAAGHAARSQSNDEPFLVVEHFQYGLLYTIENIETMDYDTRIAGVEALISETFDVSRIARTVLGRSAYRQLDTEKRQTYHRLFTRYIVATQTKRLQDRGGQSFDVGKVREGARNSIIVDATYSDAEGTTTEISYVLIDKDGAWRIVDVIVEGAVSEISLRRSEFAAVVRNEGFDGLLEQLKQKIADLRQSALADEVQ